MKAHSRKKVLVSSVAMTLVAAVSLGTATFAWFTNNKTVTADGMSVKAAAAQGLQITGDNAATWGPSYNFTTTQKTLTPISVNYTTGGTAYGNLPADTYYPGDAAADGAWTALKDDSYKDWQTNSEYASPSASNEAQGGNAYFAAYEVGLKSTGADITGVTMTVNYTGTGTQNAENYIRVAVLDQGTATAYTATTDKILTVLGNEPSANAISAVDTVATATQKVEGTKTDRKLTVNVPLTGTTINNATPNYYTVLVWFEGQDGQCVDAQQQAEGAVDLSFTYGS